MRLMASTVSSGVKVTVSIGAQDALPGNAATNVQYDAIFSRAFLLSDTDSSDVTSGSVPTTPPTPVPKYAVVRDTVRFDLDETFQDKSYLSDVVLGTTIQLNFLSFDGSPVVVRNISVPADLTGDYEPTKILLSKDEVIKLSATPAKPDGIPNAIARKAVFVSIYAKKSLDYSKCLLQLAPVTFNESFSWATSGFAALLNEQNGPLTASTPVRNGLPLGIASLPWEIARVAVDGSFVTNFVDGKWNAWAWLLSGSTLAVPILGVVSEDLKTAGTRVRSVLLPAIDVERGDGDTGSGNPEGNNDDTCHCDSAERKPVDISEAELADNPNVYTEDPGAFCKPFSAPQRVLSERSFFSILRAEQPAISSEATINLREPAQLDFDPPDEMLESINADSALSLQSLLSTNIATRAFAPTSISDLANFRETLESKSTLLNGSVLRDRLRNGLQVVVDKIPPGLADALKKLDRGRLDMSAQNPIQWDSESLRYQATTVSRGHILEFRVRTRSNGYSLGGVAKTLTLAPRQTRRIQKIEWSRSERALRSESQDVANAVNDSTSHDTSYTDVVAAHLNEWSQGSSKSSVTGAAGGAGLALGPFVIGGGVAHSSGSSSSQQSGGRNTTAQEEMQWRDAIRRHGDDVRKFESTVVQEVAQNEDVTGTVEVVRNINYAHSITVLYHNILRHMRVDTEFAGVHEALFVPFAMKPFTIQRAYRWRETLLRVLRDRRFRNAMTHLKDILTGFKYSQIPKGRRADHPIRSLYGSVFVDLGVALPGNTADGKFDIAAWNTFGGLLISPALGIWQQINALVETAREVEFQRRHAPGIAAKWCNLIEIRTASGRLLQADFTLASTYSFNRTVRIDFQVNTLDSDISRSSLTQLTVTAKNGLTQGSVANMRSMNYTYQTDFEKRSVYISQGLGDLVLPETGARDPAGAVLSSPLDQYELQNLRADLVFQTTELLQHLNENVEYYHRMIWWNMDRDRLYMLLDGFYVPGTKPGEPKVSIASVVERNPVSAAGNCLIFRVSPGAFVGASNFSDPEEMYNFYQSHQGISTPMNISLPTDGLYAQTIMDECLALEEHYGNLDWALKDPDPELGALDPSLLMSRRADPTSSTTPSKLPDTLINLQNAPAAPAPQGFEAILNAVTNANAFRDMAGLAGTQSLTTEGLKTAASLATGFGNQAAALELAQMTHKAQATTDADKKLDTIDRARKKGLITSPETLAEHASEVLAQMNGGSNKEASPHSDGVIQAAIQAAKDASGENREIEASNAKGSVRLAFAMPDPDTTMTSSGGKSDTRLSYDNFYSKFPRWDDPANTSPAVKERIGGQVNQSWVKNTCVIRISDSLVHNGVVIPRKDSGDETAVPGADGKYYMLRVKGMRQYLTRSWGPPDFDQTKEAGKEFDKSVLENMRGVIAFDMKPGPEVPPEKRYTGHFDIFDGEKFTQERGFDSSSSYWTEATRITLWALP